MHRPGTVTQDDGRRAGSFASRLRTALAVGAAAVLLYLLFRLAAGRPALVELAFARGWAPAVVPPLSRLAGVSPLPVVEIAAIGYLLRRIWTGYRAGAGVLAGRRRIADVAASGAATLARDGGICVILFYALWGFHYSRAPLAERTGLPTFDSVSTGELTALARQLGATANENYRRLHGTGDSGRPTPVPERWDELDGALQRGWERAADELDLGPLAGASFARPKPLLLGRLAARLGLTGIYSPFTAEALVVGSTPAVGLGLSLAHEQAHQRGITAEGDATFAGFVAALRSGHPLLRYSAAVRAQSRVLALLSARDPEAARTVTAERLPGVTRDLRHLRAYRLRHRGPASRVARTVNDGYLRANRVPGGVESYDQATLLLVRYARVVDPVSGPDRRTAGEVGAPAPGGTE